MILDDSGALLPSSRWKRTVVDRQGEAVRTAKILTTVLLLGAPAWIGRADGPPDDWCAGGLHRHRAGEECQRRHLGHPRGSRQPLHAGFRIGRRWKRRSSRVATRAVSGPRNAPEVGQLVLGGVSRTRSVMRARRRGRGRTIVLVTDKPGSSSAPGGPTPSRAPDRSGRASRFSWTARAEGSGTMAGAARVRPMATAACCSTTTPRSPSG